MGWCLDYQAVYQESKRDMFLLELEDKSEWRICPCHEPSVTIQKDPQESERDGARACCGGYCYRMVGWDVNTFKSNDNVLS
jgi:hypothetical protein